MKKTFIVFLFFSNLMYAQYGYSNKQVPAFLDTTNNTTDYHQSLNELNRNVQDFISENITTDFVKKHFKPNDSISFNFDLLISKTGNVAPESVKVNTDIAFFNNEISNILLKLPQFRPSRAAITGEKMNFYFTLTPEFYIDNESKFKSIYRTAIRNRIQVKSGELPLIETAQKLKLDNIQEIICDVYFSISGDKKIKDIRFNTPHINFEIMLTKLFKELDVKKMEAFNLLEPYKNYSAFIKIDLKDSYGNTSYFEEYRFGEKNKTKSSQNVFDKVPRINSCKEQANNALTQNCNNNKINTIVRKNFNFNLVDDFKLKGINKVFVYFDINKKGLVSNIRARGSHQVLEKEAIRVIKLLPIFEPAMLNNKPIKFTFSLPITFNLNNDSSIVNPLFDANNSYMRN